MAMRDVRWEPHPVCILFLLTKAFILVLVSSQLLPKLCVDVIDYYNSDIISFAIM